MLLSHSDAFREPLMQEEEEAEALAAWRERRDYKARDLILRRHARIAWSVAMRFSGRDYQRAQDLAQVGMIGLQKAMDKFDPEKGSRFGRYAIWWVKSEISQTLPQVLTVVDMPGRAFQKARSGKLPEKELTAARGAAFGVESLDSLIGEEGDATGLDFLACHRNNPEEQTQQNALQDFYEEVLKKAITVLREREAQVLTRRRLTNTPETLEEIARDMNITRERVRQIEMDAIRKVANYLKKNNFPADSLR